MSNVFTATPEDRFIPAGEAHVALGACVQAAAVLHEPPPDEVATAWELASGAVVEPDAHVDREMTRTRFGRLRDHTP